MVGKELPAKEREPFFLLVDCPVPPYFYNKRRWPEDALSACMAEAVHGARGMGDAWLHPEIMTYMSERYRERWETGRETVEKLSACLLSVFADDCLKKSGEAVVLLGSASDTLWQMEQTGRLLEPYLSRINRLTFRYEEVAGTDLWEEANDCLETYSYEYGLTPCLLPYRKDSDRTPCGLILDYGASENGVRFSAGTGAVYIDLQGSSSKERKCLAADGRILYVSPLKYLDTVVKSEYDRKM